MIKRMKITIVLLLSLFLTSCIEMQEIEKLGIINADGVDIAENNLLELTLVIFQFTIQSEEISKIISGKGKTIDGATTDAEHTSLYELAPGKSKLSIYGKEMAEKGILPLLDTKSRDARVPDLMYLAVSNTTAKEILSIKEEDIHTDMGQYLYEIINNHATDHNVPRKTLQDFLRIYYDVGHDNLLPLFSITEKAPKLNAIAIFRGDKMVGEMTTDEAVFINLMERTVKEEVLELSIPIEPFEDDLENREDRDQKKEVEIAILITNGKSKTNLIDIENLSFQTDTTIEFRLIEQSAGIKLDTSEIIKKIEQEVEKKMTGRFEEILKKLQKLEADSFGYGLYYKSSDEGKDLTNEEWREKFPEIDVTFNVDVKMIRHGVTD